MFQAFRFLIVLIVLVCVASAQQSSAPVQDHDFGVVPQGPKLIHIFPIRNSGEMPLRIDRVDASLPGISARFQPLIQPGAEGRITVEWNTAEAAGVLEANLVVRTNDARKPAIPLRVKAIVKPPVEFLPYPAVFFSAYRDEGPERKVRIVNNQDAPLNIARIESPGNHYTVALDTVQPGKVYDLRVKVRPGAAFGRYTEQIILTTDQPQNNRFQIGANLFVKPDFYAFPEVIDFGSISLETLVRQPKLVELLTQTTVLTNRSRPLEIQSVTTDVPFIDFTRTPKSGKETRFRIDVVPVRERMQRGKIAGHVRVLTNDPRHRELIIPVHGEVR